MPFTINGLTPTEMGFHVEQMSGWASGPTVRRGAVALTGPWGHIPSQSFSYQPVSIKAVLGIVDVAVASRDAAIAIVQDRLRGLMEFVADDQPDKVALVRLSSVGVASYHPPSSFAVGDVLVAITLTMYQALKVDAVALTRALTTAGQTVRVGTGPTVGRIWIRGAATNPTITLTNFRGEEVESIEITDTLTSAQSLMIDLFNEHIYDVTDPANFVRHDDVKTGGAFFTILPEYGDRINSLWPRLTLAAGTGWIEYHRTWRS